MSGMRGNFARSEPKRSVATQAGTHGPPPPRVSLARSLARTQTDRALPLSTHRPNETSDPTDPSGRMTEWGRRTRKYFEKKIKKAKEVVAKARRRRGDDGDAGNYGAVDDAEAALAPSRTPTLRRLKSQRSNKFDPDILAAWGMNPVLFTNEDDSGERTDHMRVETISHHPGGHYSPGENPRSSFAADERDPLVKKLQSGRSRLSESGRALESAGEDAFYSPTWAEVPALRLRAIYFLVCFAMSISSPFFVLFMKTDLGLSAGQVGLVAALQIVGGYAVGPAVSLIVDRFQIHKVSSLPLPIAREIRAHTHPPTRSFARSRQSLWIVSILIGIVPVELITRTRSFEGALGIALCIAAVNAPISSLLDSSTLRFLGEHHAEYGKVSDRGSRRKRRGTADRHGCRGA